MLSHPMPEESGAWSDDPPTRIRYQWPLPEAEAEADVPPPVDVDRKTCVVDVGSGLIPRSTLRVQPRGLIVVVEPGPELREPARMAADKLGLSAIEIDLDAVTEFVALWRPIAILIEDRRYSALLGRLRKSIASPILRVGLEATRRPDLATRLADMITGVEAEGAANP
jgi:hypothetical protein